MNISYIKFNSTESRLIVKLAQVLEGKEWSRIISVSGEEALNIWNKWGTDNDKEIIKLLIDLE